MPDYNEIGAYNRYPDNINILTDVKFRFAIRKLPNVNYFCQSIQIPSIKLGVAEQATPLQDLPLPGVGLQFDELSVQFLVDEDMKNYYEIFKWLTGIGFPKENQQYRTIRNQNLDLNAQFGGILSDAIVHVLSNESNPKVNLIYRDAFPVYLSAISLSTAKDTSDPVTAEVLFRFAYIDFEYVI